MSLIVPAMVFSLAYRAMSSLPAGVFGGPTFSGILLGRRVTPPTGCKVKVSGIQVLTWIPQIAGRFTLPQIVPIMPAQSLGSIN